jgi:hypothetical protein
MDIATTIATLATPGGIFGTPIPTVDPNAPVSTEPAACSWWDDIWPSQACIIARGQQQIAEVPTNAAAVAAYYAATQPGSVQAANAAAAAQIAQNFAATQIATVPSDVASIENYYSTSGGGLVPFTIPWWAWALAAGFGLWAIAK